MHQEDLTKLIKEDQALFLPSISSIYVRLVSKPDENIREGNLPKGIPHVENLNFLDKDNALFYYPYALYSLGHALLDLEKSNIREKMVQQRDRANTTIIGDSGGFQIAKGVLKWPWGKAEEQDDMRGRFLKWLEHTADWSMTLDVPYKVMQQRKDRSLDLAMKNKRLATLAHSEEKRTLTPEEAKEKKKLESEIASLQKFISALPATREQCSNGTVENLAFFMANRTPGATKFLNVCQGENHEEADTWFDAVKGFNDRKLFGERAFEGWAFGGVSAFDFELIMRRMIVLRDEGLLEGADWLHFLGSGKVHGACAFTELQRILRKEVNPNIRVSYDAASPFVSAAHGRIYTNYLINSKNISIPMEQVVDNKFFNDEEKKLPFFLCNSPIGQRLTLGDVCFNQKEQFKSAWDGYSYVLLMAHSLYLHIKAIQTANLLYDVPENSRPNGNDLRKQHLPSFIFEMQDIWRQIFASENPFDTIEKHKKFLQGYLGVTKERKGTSTIHSNPLFAKPGELEKFDIEEVDGEAVDVLDDAEFAELVKDDLEG